MPKADIRAAEMALMRSEGKTLAEIGERYGLSRERIRQVLAKGGYDPHRLKMLAAANRDRSYVEALEQELTEHRAAIRRLLLNGGSVDGTARDLGVTRAAVRLIDGELGGLGRGMKRSAQVPKYTDAEILDCLRGASNEVGGVLTGEDYNDVAEVHQLADGRQWPGRQTAMLRFGTWRDALQAAGLAYNKSSGIRGKRLFEREHCIDALLEVARAVGHLPTYAQYEAYARAMGGILPSGSTIRHRLGGWTGARLAAARFIATSQQD